MASTGARCSSRYRSRSAWGRGVEPALVPAPDATAARLDHRVAGVPAAFARVLFVALLQYVCGTVALIVAGVTVAAWAGFAHLGRTDLPVIVAYLMLGSAMFLALLLQTMRVRAVPLAAAAAALAIEIALRDTGMVDPGADTRGLLS